MYDTARRITMIWLVLALILVPSVAYAEVSWQSGTGRKTAVVSPYPYDETGRCGALMEYLGFDWSTIGSDARNKLLTNSNGDNPFTQSLAQVYNVQYETNGTLNYPVINVWSTIFGLSQMWDISLTESQYDNTVAYVRQVIMGETSGGGGSGGGTGSDEVVVDGVTYVPWTAGSSTGNLFTLVPTPTTTLTDSIVLDVTDLNSAAVADTEPLYTSRVYSGTALTFCTFFVPDGISIMVKKGVSNSNIYAYNNTDATIRITYKSTSTVYLNSQTQQYKPSSYNGSTGTVNVYSHSVNNLQNVSEARSFARAYFGGAVVTPTPTPPTPDPPVTPPTQPTGPTYNNTTNNNVTYNNVTVENDPSSSDVLDWLKLIHRDLTRISQEVNSYFSTLSNQLTGLFNNLTANLRGWFEDISTYLGNMLRWMVQDLQYYFDKLDEHLTNWLRRIYSRLGGNGAGKPDVTDDDEGFWDWLVRMFTEFFVGDVQATAGTLQNVLEDLTEFFPFSLPWDLMAILALLQAQPVTPVFDLYMPVPDIFDARGYIPIEVDCTPYNGVAATVRAMELLIFAAALISKVPEWLNQIKMNGDAS